MSVDTLPPGAVTQTEPDAGVPRHPDVAHHHLRGFVPERGKVLPRRISGTCAKHQRGLRIAIVRARQLALLPYASTAR